jgi:hypothetical protein
MGNARRKSTKIGHKVMDVSPNSIEHLILEGAVEVAGMDLESGEMLYSFTANLEKISPEVYAEITSTIYRSILSIWEKGFFEMSLDDESELVVKLNNKSKDEHAIKEQLDKSEQHMLKQLVRIVEEKL